VLDLERGDGYVNDVLFEPGESCPLAHLIWQGPDRTHVACLDPRERGDRYALKATSGRGPGGRALRWPPRRPA
jgi:hypothetical protein